MTQPLSLSLQAFPPHDKGKDSLQYLIQRVNAERGSFRNVTEQSLEDEIRNSEVEGDDKYQEDPMEIINDAGDPNIKKQEVAQAREEILKQTAQSLSESRTALDFVSLLLSKNAPAAAQTTMSPFLKQNLPLGSLGAEVNQAPLASGVEKHNEEMVGIGWRMQSLNGAADFLLKSATRLEDEMGRETKYWEQVLAVKENGWSLHRLPREKHTLGVRYGFAEADSDFRDRGLAALRRDENSDLILDRGIRSKGDRKLCIRMLQDGKPIASNIGDTSAAVDNASVEREILNARDSIYDEELYHEIDREARKLVNQGVRCIDGNILLPYETSKQIELSLVPWDEESAVELESNDPTLDIIAITLRLLLSHAHRQTLQNRSRTPLPLRENKQPRPIYALLKPVIEFLQHRSHVRSTQAYLDGIKNTLAATGVDVLTAQITSSHDFHQLLQTDNPSDGSIVGNLLRQLTSALHTSFTLTFPEEPTTITLEIRTAIQPPHFGTTFQVTVQGSALEQILGALPTPETFITTNTLQTHVLHVVTLALQTRMISGLPDWRIVSLHSHSIVRKKSNAQGKDVISLELLQGRLELNWRSSLAAGARTWTWCAGTVDGESTQTGLMDVIGSL